MNVNKRFDRLKQWGKERMGGEKQTDTTDEFKALEVEMQLRQDGMERLKKSSDVYIQAMAKRDRYQDKEQQLPIGFLGTSMVNHGNDFEPDSEFGQCLTMMGRANERIARMQETYCANATSSWLESLERSLVQMKEYQKARKQLETRRLAYDTASTKMQKSKKEDFRMEEELRQQKMKYEESSEDVYRRMLDIKEAEVESVQDLTTFLEAELTYYDRCREVLMLLKRDWPAQATLSNRSGTASPVNGGIPRRVTRSRASSTNDRFSRIAEDEPLEPPPRPTIGSRVPSGANSPYKELPGFDLPVRSNIRSTSTSGFEGPTALNARADSPAGMPRITRVPTEPGQILGARSNLRITKSRGGDTMQGTSSEVIADDQSDFSDQASMLTDHHRTASWSNVANAGSTTRKAPPPPPPPSRGKKPPPPLPVKRSALSTGEVPHY